MSAQEAFRRHLEQIRDASAHCLPLGHAGERLPASFKRLQAVDRAGWPTRVVDEAEVKSWDRSALTSTGMKIDGDLAVIDVDVKDAALVVEALAGALDQRFPSCSCTASYGTPEPRKPALRCPEPFRRLASRRWYRGKADPDDPALPASRSSASARWVAAVCNPRTARPLPGEVISTYQFVGNASPATMSRTSLPVLPQAAYGLLRPVRPDRRGGGPHCRHRRRSGARRGHVLRARRRHRDRDARSRRDDGRRAGAPAARARGTRQCAGNAALLGPLPRSDPGAD